MKAIKVQGAFRINNGTYEFVSEEESVYYCKIKNVTTAVRKEFAEIVEIEDAPKSRSRKPSTSSKQRSNVDMYITSIKNSLIDTYSGRSIYAAIERSNAQMTDIVKSILSQANYKSGYISDKQIFVLAKFMETNDISLNDIPA